MTTSGDRTLIFGGLALLNDYLTRDQIRELIRDWSADKSKNIGALAQAKGFLSESVREAIEKLVDDKLGNPTGDHKRTLAAVPAARTMIDDLRDVSDADIQATIASFDSEATRVEPSADSVQITHGAMTKDHRFEVKRFHARGGLGEVFLAHDKELDRDVALKEIKLDRAHDGNSQARFLLEAQITGGLEHPGVVPVYALGQYPDGRPYYAMRFIKGQSLHERIKQYHAATMSTSDRNLALRDLLQRFVDVCNTVQYAHDQGVLHRDLKPGNVMLGNYGETLVVDWGLAKQLHAGTEGEETADSSSGDRAAGGSTIHSSMTENPDPDFRNPASSRRAVLQYPVTEPGRGLGTHGYMSPEQARGDVDSLGPTTDVYALGATLFTLLTGEGPSTANPKHPDRNPVVNRAAALPKDSTNPTIVEEEAPSPRRPREIKPEIPAALEAICLRAMSRDVSDRYPSCGSLANDIRHWLADEPVIALADPPLVRLQRWSRKHPGPLSAIAAALLVGLAGLTAGIYFINAERKLTELARHDEQVQRMAAEQNRTEAQDREAETAAVLNFVEKKILHTARPKDQQGGLGRDVKMRDAIQAAIPSVGKSFSGKPIIEAKLRDTIGISLMHLGNYDLARQQFEASLKLRKESLGADHLWVATSMNNLGNSLVALGRFEEVVKLREEVVRTYKSKLGPDAPDTLTCMSNLANLYSELGRHSQALELDLETLRRRTEHLGPDHPDTLMSMHNLFVCYLDLGRNKEAFDLGEQTLRLRKEKIGPNHPDTLMTMNSLANVYAALGKHKEALAMLNETLRIKTEALGPDHPETLRTRLGLANRYSSLGNVQESFRLNMETLALQKVKLGPSHPDTLMTMNNLAISHLTLQRNREAAELLDEALSLLKAGNSKGIVAPPDTIRRIHWTRACVMEELHRYPEADQDWDACLALCQPHEKAALIADRKDSKSKRSK